MKESPGDERAKHGVNGEFTNRMEDAEDDVKDNPCQREPASPVTAKEQEDSGDDGGEFGDFDPDAVGFVREQGVEVTDEPGNADREIEDGDNPDGDGAAVGIHDQPRIAQTNGSWVQDTAKCCREGERVEATRSLI